MDIKRGKMLRIVFPEGEDERILKAASVIAKEKIAKVILLGNIDKILSKLERLRLKFNVSVINPSTATEKDVYMQKLYEIRRKKGLTPAGARKLIEDKNYFACMMLLLGECDAVLSGAVFSTPQMLRPAFQIIKTEKGVGKASGAVLTKLKGKNYLFADVGVQEEPNPQELAEIAKLSARTFERLTGEKARVAMLSYSTHSAKGKSQDIVRKATSIARRYKLNVEGEIQLDAALIKEVAKRKHVRFIDANVLIFPDLNAGNIGYKLVKIFANAEIIGVIIQGLKKPVNDLSKGCNVKDIVNLAKVTIIQLKK